MRALKLVPTGIISQEAIFTIGPSLSAAIVISFSDSFPVKSAALTTIEFFPLSSGTSASKGIFFSESSILTGMLLTDTDDTKKSSSTKPETFVLNPLVSFASLEVKCMTGGSLSKPVSFNKDPLALFRKYFAFAESAFLNDSSSSFMAS